TFILDIRYEVATLLAKSKKKNLSTRVHPEALDAFNFFHSMVFKFDKVQVGLEAINAIQCDQIYRAVLSKPDQLELISGFEFFSFSLQHFNLDDAVILVESDLQSRQISDLAWRSVLRVLLSSVENQSLEIMRQHINIHTPSHLLSDYFGTDHLTQKQFAELTNMSVSGLKKQSKYNPKPPQKFQAKPALFEQMKERFGNE
ncbi:TPA: hypothetical protein ACY4QB_004268, partial [Vibrio parahaemolyticus]